LQPSPIPARRDPHSSLVLEDRPLELVLSPVDNQRLANLCGALDENCDRSRPPSTSPSRAREKFTLRGTQRRARRVLQKFYGEAKRGLTLDDIQLGLIEVRARGGNAKAIRPSSPGAPICTAERHGSGNTSEHPRARHHLATPGGHGQDLPRCACAVDALERDAVKRIVLVRPAVEAGERLGFLPGDLAQKVDPYLRPLYDALYDLLGFDRTGKLFERGAIELHRSLICAAVR